MAVQTARKLVPADSLANRLILVRRELGLSQREAAQRCGVGFGSWQSWENGSAPRNALRDLVWVAERLGVDRDWLMFGGPLRPDDGLELPRGDSNTQPADMNSDLGSFLNDARIAAGEPGYCPTDHDLHVFRKAVPITPSGIHHSPNGTPDRAIAQ